MKTIYLIGGTMGAGKTTVSQQLKKKLPNSVFLDGDWCWDADPFQVTEETKELMIFQHIFTQMTRLAQGYEDKLLDFRDQLSAFDQTIQDYQSMLDGTHEMSLV